MSRVWLYDTTLRDGTQAEDVSFLVADKIRIAQKLDELGIDYIEGGWPGSNPKDIAFFKDVRKVKLQHAKIAAFGSTRRAKLTPDKDNNIRTLVQAEPDTVTIFGKTCALQDLPRTVEQQALEELANYIVNRHR